MNNDLVTVATFQFLPEAEISKLRLEAEGLTVFLFDTATVAMDWFLGNAIGYIKLQVPSSQAEAAGAVLEQMRGERALHVERAEEIETDKCLACGAALPEEATKCPACGWTYSGSDDM